MDSLIRAMEDQKVRDVLINQHMQGYDEAQRDVAIIMARNTSDHTKLMQIRDWLET